jgi:hypothetical protein
MQLVYTNQTVPLIRSRRLRVLQLVFPECCSHLDNVIVFEAMTSWPHIHSLELMDLHLRSPAITFRELFAAFRLCPHLQTLQTFADAAHIDMNPTTESFQHTSLQALDLESSPEAVDAEAVARMTFSILPCIHQVNRIYAGRYCRNDWQEVNRYPRSFKSSSILDRQIMGASWQS